MPNGQWPEELELTLRRTRLQLRGFRPRRIVPIFAALVILAFLWSSWFTVQPEETAVVRRFGRVVRTAGPGLHFKFPFAIETVNLVPTARVLKEEFGFRTSIPGRRTQYESGDFSNESLMLTGDLNVIDVQWIVQYRIEDPMRYLFQVREQGETLRDVTEAVMRRVVGNRLGSDVLTVGRASVAAEVKEEMQKILSAYQTGIQIITVELQDVTPPDPVKPAFNEVNEARQDRERMINQAQEQANKVIPKARGEAKQSIAEAEGYATERVNQARGEATRFLAVLEEYERVPRVTRRRLYLEATSEMLRKAKGIYVVDSDQRALVPWLPLGSAPGERPAKQVKEPGRSP
ncbi:MAG: FtsH protease activity modulator HflK [Deltaproteobacteria bacterium]|nr:FtsH protease activity modulator HflK [Deltaproteobacteria bacterium]